MEQTKRLYRNRFDSVIGGVAGGLAKYFNLDPMLIRLLFVVLAFLAAGGVVAYIILWIVMPINPDEYYENRTYFKNESTMEKDVSSTNQERKDNKTYPDYKPKNDGSLIAGILLITIGGMFLISRFIPNIDFGDLWPVILIVVGIIIIAGAVRKN